MGRADLPYDLQLGGFDLLGGEAEDADAPGRVAERLPGLFQYGTGLVGAGQRERDEGQPPWPLTSAANAAWSLTRVIGPWATGSSLPKGRPPEASGPSEAPAFFAGSRPGPALFNASRTASHAPHRRVDGAPALLETGGEEAVLTDLGRACPPGTPAPYDSAAVLHGRLGAVETGEQRGGPGGQVGLGLGEQGELGVQDDTGATARDDGRRGVRARAAAGPDREGPTRRRRGAVGAVRGVSSPTGPPAS